MLLKMHTEPELPAHCAGPVRKLAQPTLLVSQLSQIVIQGLVGLVARAGCGIGCSTSQ